MINGADYLEFFKNPGVVYTHQKRVLNVSMDRQDKRARAALAGQISRDQSASSEHSLLYAERTVSGTHAHFSRSTNMRHLIVLMVILAFTTEMVAPLSPAMRSCCGGSFGCYPLVDPGCKRCADSTSYYTCNGDGTWQ